MSERAHNVTACKEDVPAWNGGIPYLVTCLVSMLSTAADRGALLLRLPCNTVIRTNAPSSGGLEWAPWVRAWGVRVQRGCDLMQMHIQVIWAGEERWRCGCSRVRGLSGYTQAKAKRHTSKSKEARPYHCAEWSPASSLACYTCSDPEPVSRQHKSNATRRPRHTPHSDSITESSFGQERRLPMVACDASTTPPATSW